MQKKWKNETVDLEAGRHWIDDEIFVRVSGTVEKREDQFISSTISIPLILTLALLIEKMGITRDHALRMLRQSITEAMIAGVSDNACIKERITDVEKAVGTVRKELIDQLPKMKRCGSLVLDDLRVVVDASVSSRFIIGTAA